MYFINLWSSPSPSLKGVFHVFLNYVFIKRFYYRKVLDFVKCFLCICSCGFLFLKFSKLQWFIFIYWIEIKETYEFGHLNLVKYWKSSQTDNLFEELCFVKYLSKKDFLNWVLGWNILVQRYNWRYSLFSSVFFSLLDTYL